MYDRIYYRYAEPDYSISDTPLTEDDCDLLKKAVALLGGDGKRDEVRDILVRVRNRLETLLNYG